MDKNRQATITGAIQSHQGANKSYLETGIKILELSNKAATLFKVRNPGKKQQLLNKLLSNCTLSANKVVPTYRKPFDILVEGSSRSNLLREISAIRTYFIRNLAFGNYVKHYVLRGNGIPTE